MRDSEGARVEGDKLNSPITHTNIIEEWSKVKGGAPGLDNVRIMYINMQVQPPNRQYVMLY